MSGWGSVSQRMQVFYSRSEKTGIFCPLDGQRTPATGGQGREENRKTSERPLQQSRQDDRGCTRAEVVKGKADGLRSVLGVALTPPAGGIDM